MGGKKNGISIKRGKKKIFLIYSNQWEEKGGEKIK